MDDATQAYWQAYVRQIADLLGLKDWQIIVSRDTPGVLEAWAEISCTDGQRCAVIRFAHQWPAGADTEKQREVVTHELLHCHLHEIKERVDFVAERFGDNSLVSAMPELVRHEIEHAVDALSRIVAPFLPLPPSRDPGTPVNGLTATTNDLVTTGTGHR